MTKSNFFKRVVSIAAVTAMLAASLNCTAFAREDTDTGRAESTFTESPPTATGTVYHVDGQGGSDEEGDGTEAKPFKTLAKVNDIVLKPGDGISLKKGSIFDNQRLAPKGKGTESKPIVINTYGEGNRPVIHAGGFKMAEGTNPDGTPKYTGHKEAVLIENMEYTWVTGLEVTNDDAFNKTGAADDPNNWRSNSVGIADDVMPRRLGIHVTIDERASDTYKGSDREYRGITIDDCYVHDVDGNENRGVNKVDGGIGIEVIFSSKAGIYPYFNGVTIQNNRIDKCDRTGIKGIRISDLDNFRHNVPGPGYDPNNDADNNAANDGSRSNNIRNHDQMQRGYKVVGNYLSDIGGDGILICETQDAVVEHNVLNGQCMRAQGANAGIWAWNAFDTAFRYNESFGGPAYNQDGCSYDSDYLCAGTLFEYNYSHDTPMGFMLLMGGNDTDVVRYNVSQNDGIAFRHIAGNSNTPSYIYNNVFYYDGAKWKYNYSAPAMAGKNNWQMFNNIFYNTNKDNPSKWGDDADWSKVVTEKNMVYETGGVSGAGEIPGAIHADPKFVKPGGGEGADMTKLESKWDSLSAYQLQAESPAANTGVFVNVVPQSSSGNVGHWDTESDRNAKTDFFGNPLYNGAADIGLHETTDSGSVSYPVEANASYKLYDQPNRQYLAAGDDGLATMGAEGTEFILVNEGSGYQVRVWNTEQNAYLYLNVVEGTVALSQDNTTVWSLKDMNNGLHRLETGGKALATDNKTLVMAAKDSATQWQLQLQEHSKFFNVGGEIIDGYSADQEYEEAKSKSGHYGDVKKVSKKLTGENEIYSTALTGDSIGYKIFASKGEYNLKLNIAELEDVKDRTFSIIINGALYQDSYTVGKTVDTIEIASVFPENGIIDVRLSYGYNSDKQKTQAILNGISAEKLKMSEVNMRLNCGSSKSYDGLSADAQYPVKGSGYYGDGTTELSFETLPSPDAGMGTVLKSAREGTDFGYKFKAQPGSYRVKMYFNDASAEDHIFNVSVNGKDESSVNVKEQAGGAAKGMAVTKIANSAGGIIDISFKAQAGSKAMVNAIVVEPYTQPEGVNFAAGKTGFITSSTKNDDNNNYGPALAVDQNDATRWSSKDGDAKGWYQIDLEKPYMVDRVAVDFTPGAYATTFRIDTSNDGTTWDTAKLIQDAEPGLNVVSLEPIEARYVKIASEAANDQWGISFTELGIYGEEVTGPAEAVVTSEKMADPSDDYEVKVQLQNIFKRYSTITLKASYDSAKAEFVKDKVLNDTLNIMGEAVTGTDEATGFATREYRFDIMKKDAFKTLNDVMKLQFTPKGEERAKILIDVKLSDAAGHYTELPQKKAYVPNNVSAADLNTLIQEAVKMADEAVVGVKPGTYTQEAVDTLKAATAVARQTADMPNPAQPELVQAFALLESAMEQFTVSVNVAAYTTYHEDFTVDQEVNYEGASINGNGVNIVTAAGKVTANTKAPELLSGTFYTRFSTTGIQDQFLFRIKNEGKPIVFGYDSGTGRWFYDKTADSKWGNFDAGNALDANKVHELMMRFQHKGEGVFDLTLTVDGQDLGTRTAKYDAVKGGYAFAARNKETNRMIYESYYTDSPAHNITVTSNLENAVSQTGQVLVFDEADKTFKFNTPDGYEVKEIKVDGAAAEVKDNGYTFEFIKGDHTLDVIFDRADGQEAITYHQDYKINTESNYSIPGTVENGRLKLALPLRSNNDDKQKNPTFDLNANPLLSGVMDVKFSVNNTTADQLLFYVKAGGDKDIVVGYEKRTDGKGMWFYDNAGSAPGYGDIGEKTLTADEDHQLKVEFTHKGNGVFDLTLLLDGEAVGTAANVTYDINPGTFGFGARRNAKEMTIKEVYYTNEPEYTIESSAGEHGTVDEAGSIKTYGGANKTFLYTPEEGYVVSKVTVDGETYAVADNRYTIENIQGNHSIQAVFKKEEAKSTYHKDYLVDTESGFMPSGTVTDGADKLTLAKSNGDKGFQPVTAKDAPQFTSGTLYTRFSVDNVGDQTLFFVKDSDRRIIIGFDAELNQWFYDNAANGKYGFFNKGGVIQANQDHEVIIQFLHKGSGLYDLTLSVDGVNLGTIENEQYDEQPGGFSYAARRTAKTIAIKEAYYTNMEAFNIAVEAGVGGTASQSGDVVVYQGADKVFKFTPDPGYLVDTVTADGEQKSGDSYTFQNIQGNHTLAVTFKAEQAAIDKAELQALYDLVKDTEQGNYTDASYQIFTDALGAAKVVLDNADATQEEVNLAVTTLQGAFDGLEEKVQEVDKTKLQTLYNTVKDTEKGSYTDESYQLFTEALIAAKAVLDKPGATQEEVDGAAGSLQTAYEGLTEGEQSADKSKLQILYNKVKDTEKGSYTDESYQIFTDALTSAKAVLDKQEATQEEVDSAESNLQAAYDGLTEGEQSADKSKLQTLYNTVKDTEKGNYTEASYQIFIEALNAARNVLDQPGATQEEVNGAESMLQQAYDGLTENLPAADKSKLEALVNEVAGLNKGDYMSDSYNVLQSAKDKAQAVLNDQSATQQQINKALAELSAARDGLVPKKNIIEAVPQLPSLPHTTIQGEFADGAELVVRPLPSEGQIYSDLAAQLPAGSQVIAAVEMSIQGDAKGPFVITFQVGEQHNGRLAVILHQKADGTIERFENITVENGVVTIQVDELSPFIIALQKESEQQPGGSTGEKPKDPVGTDEPVKPVNPSAADTGGKSPNTSDPLNAGAAAAGMILAAGAVLLIAKKRRA